MRVIITTTPVGAILNGESKSIDWRNASDRTWLKNHTHWAIMNQHMVTVAPAAR